MSITAHVIAQFRQPQGIMGHLAGWIMYRRSSNRHRNLWTLKLLDVELDNRVLEIGFGPGYAIEHLLRRVPTVQVTGIDHSEVMLRQATRRSHTAIAKSQVKLLCLSTDKLRSLNRGPFNRIYSVNAAQFWPDRVKVFQDILELLAPGGRVVTTYLPRHAKATNDDAVAFGETLLREMYVAGFREARVEHGPRLPLLTIGAVGSRPV